VVGKRMNKERFLKELKRNLKGLPKDEVEDIVADFEEHFTFGIKGKRTEEELSKSLGDPKMLAKELKAVSYLKKAEETSSTTNITMAVFASIGMGFFNIIFILPPFICIAAVILVFFSTAIAIAASGIAGFFGSIFYPFFTQYLTFAFNPAVGIFGFLGIAALGLLFFIGVVYLSRFLYRQLVRYLRFNLSVIKGRREKDEI
jgi:uncharacterized membrane protein